MSVCKDPKLNAISDDDWITVIQHIAEVSNNFSFYAGVGGMETAGAIISFLAAHPNRLGEFLAGGITELPQPLNAFGGLSWHRQDNGQVITPDQARAQSGTKTH